MLAVTEDSNTGRKEYHGLVWTIFYGILALSGNQERVWLAVIAMVFGTQGTSRYHMDRNLCIACVEIDISKQKNRKQETY